MSKNRRYQQIGQIIQFIKNPQRHKVIKIKETAAPIGRLNFLRTQFREESLYLMLIESAKTRAVKTQGWTGMMVSPQAALKALYWWIKKIAEYKKKQIQDPIPQATVVTETSPQGWEQRQNQILERTAGHSLKNNSFRNGLQRVADNQYPNQIRQPLSDLRFKETKINMHFSTSSEEDLPRLLTFEYENNNITRPWKDKHNCRCSQQIVQIRRLSPSPILSSSNKNGLEFPTNSRSIHIINNQTTTALCDGQHKRLTSPMDRCVLQHMDQREPIGTPSNPNFIKSDFISQQRDDFSNSNSTMVAGEAMVYKLNELVKQVPYPWKVKSMPIQRTKHGKSKKLFTTRKNSSVTREREVEKGRMFLIQILDRIGLSRSAQQQLINGQRLETMRHYLYGMRKLNDFIEQYEIRKTGDPKVCPNSTLFTWINRQYWHYVMDFEHFANIFWQLDGQPVDKRRIKLARQGFETTKLNIFTLRSEFLRAVSNHYIYATNAENNDIASYLVGSHGQSFTNQTISLQRGGAIERSNISTLPWCSQQHSGNSTLSRSSIAQPLAFPFYETLPVGRGIEPTDNTRALQSEEFQAISMTFSSQLYFHKPLHGLFLTSGQLIL
ncbi:MAG: hypothetical protein EZS28_010983 [Streblomastix strix]|uniref:Uncharacterized protein n=1 Tax=Streblomastix strix TaxID=222440 RepID=A0A5J4WEX7_9EUKA|nr:MAG: hypothetical protein EZS28_010983 [Streblomastix strix]